MDAPLTVDAQGPFEDVREAGGLVSIASGHPAIATSCPPRLFNEPVTYFTPIGARPSHRPETL